MIQTIQNEIQKNEFKIIKRVTELWDNFKQLYIWKSFIYELDSKKERCEIGRKKYLN